MHTPYTYILYTRLQSTSWKCQNVTNVHVQDVCNKQHPTLLSHTDIWCMQSSLKSVNYCRCRLALLCLPSPHVLRKPRGEPSWQTTYTHSRHSEGSREDIYNTGNLILVYPKFIQRGFYCTTRLLISVVWSYEENNWNCLTKYSEMCTLSSYGAQMCVWLRVGA